MMRDEPAMLISDQCGANLLGISRATWWRRVNDGTLPKPVRIGGLTRWSRKEVMAVLDQALVKRDEVAQ